MTPLSVSRFHLQTSESCLQYVVERTALTGQVNVKAPPPTNMFGERSTQEWSNNASNAVSATNEPGINRPFLQWHRIGTDYLRSREDPRRAESSNRSPHDKGHRTRRGAANQRTEFEQGECGEEDPFDIEVAVEFAEEELEGAGGKEVGGTVPTHVVEGLELVGNARDGGGDDGVVERNAEDGYT